MYETDFAYFVSVNQNDLTVHPWPGELADLSRGTPLLLYALLLLVSLTSSIRNSRFKLANNFLDSAHQADRA